MGTLRHLVRLFSALSRSTRVVHPPEVQPIEHYWNRLLRADGRFYPEVEDFAAVREPLFDARDVRLILFWTFAGGWTALLLALRVGVVEAYTVPCAVLLVADGLRSGPLILRTGLALAFAPSLIASFLADPAWARFAFLIAGGVACARIARRDARLAGGVAVAVGAVVGVLRAIGLPVGIVAEVVGVLAGLAWLAFGPRPVWHSSWRSLGPPLALTFAPPLIASFLADPSWARRLFLIAGGALTVVIGLRRRLQAPLVVGAFVLAAALLHTVWQLVR